MPASCPDTFGYERHSYIFAQRRIPFVCDRMPERKQHLGTLDTETATSQLLGAHCKTSNSFATLNLRLLRLVASMSILRIGD